MHFSISTRTALIGLVAATAVPLAVVAAALIGHVADQQRSLVDRRNIDAARAIVVAIDQEVQSAISALALVPPTVPQMAGSSVERLLQLGPSILARQPAWRTLWLLDAQGKRLGGTTTDASVLENPTASSAIQRAVSSRKVEVSDLLPRVGTAGATYLVVAPIAPDDTIRGLLAVEVSTQPLSDVLQRQNLPPNGVVTLLDRSRRIMARTRGEPELIGRLPSRGFQNAADRMHEGAWHEVLLEGIPAYAALSRSPLTGWTVGVGFPTIEVERPIRESLLWLGAAGVVTLGTFLTVAALLARLILQGFEDCSRNAGALSREEAVSFAASPLREVAAVSRNMLTAAQLQTQRRQEREGANAERAEAFAQRELALRSEHDARVVAERNEARLNVTLRSIGDGVVATDTAGAITLMNPVAQALTGWAESEVLGRPIEQVLDLISEATGEPIENPVKKVLRLGKASGLSNDAILRSRSGHETPVEDSASPIRTTSGLLIGVVVVLRDASSHRETERAQQTALVRERRARGEAEAASQAKDDFLATLSHELRTPLNAVLGWSQMLRRGQVAERGREHALEIIERNARMQVQLVSDLLDLSRIVRREVQLDRAEIRIGVLVEDVFDAVRHAAGARDIQLSLDDRLTDVVLADPARVRQILWNLLVNAIKFSPSGATITVTAVREDHEAVVKIADTGIGIARADLPRIFDRFWRAHTTSSEHQGGLGIGLSLVRYLVELHGGTVSADSKGVGHGATFTIRLPLGGDRS